MIIGCVSCVECEEKGNKEAPELGKATSTKGTRYARNSNVRARLEEVEENPQTTQQFAEARGGIIQGEGALRADISSNTLNSNAEITG
jgi:hypothetical protein